ncbi:MAG: HAD hydrolase-like protein [Alphaproteobacteria bacterium]|nr:HAD hydrolase-like protein [Alphaproteobacteria bacterium]
MSEAAPSAHWRRALLEPFSILLLDMNGTFMFGGDRFSAEQNYAATYRTLGGDLDDATVNGAIAACYAYLDQLYPDPVWHDRFPSLADALLTLEQTRTLPEHERRRLERTFALHEVGRVPDDHAEALRRLRRRHRLALVADIWAPKHAWLDELDRAGVSSLFDALIFSSDGSSVKPSPATFERALAQTGATPETSVVIGDSVRRDLGGAAAAGVACILVGGAEDAAARAAVPSLTDLV